MFTLCSIRLTVLRKIPQLDGSDNLHSREFSIYWRLGETAVKRITVTEFGMDDGGNNGRGCFGIKVRMDAMKLANILSAKFRAD